MDRLGHLGQDGDHLLHGELPAHLLQVGPPHQLHGDPQGPLVVVHVVDPADVRVHQPGVDLGLVHEPDQRRRLDVLQHLQGHRAAQDHVPGLVHVPHAAPAQERAQHVAPFPGALGVQPRGLVLVGLDRHEFPGSHGNVER